MKNGLRKEEVGNRHNEERCRRRKCGLASKRKKDGKKKVLLLS